MEALLIKNEGAELRNKHRMDKLVEKAKYWLNYNYSEAYIQSQMYVSRDEYTSIEDIENAINLAKNKNL